MFYTHEVFVFPRFHHYIKTYQTQVLNIARLDLNQLNCKQKIRNEVQESHCW